MFIVIERAHMSQYNYEAVPQFIYNGYEAATVSTHGMENAVHVLKYSWAVKVDSDAGGLTCSAIRCFGNVE
jgi:hypothetical protein